jgi:pilus assembly protein CpaE
VLPISVGIIIQSKEIWEELHASLETVSARVVFELAEMADDWTPLLDRIARTRPDVVLIEVTKLRDPLEEVVRRIRATPANPHVFALHTEADSTAILSALRAGASEYLFPPFNESLKSALERISKSDDRVHEHKKRGGRSIAFLSSKGGCGATTLACHIALHLPQVSGGKVLLADLDMQSGMVGFLVKAKSSYSVADAASNLQRLDQSYWRALISNGIPNLEIITAPTTPVAKQTTPEQLRHVLAFARTLYDWTVVDLGRNLTQQALVLLDMIDTTYLVTTQEVPALHQTKQMVQSLLTSGYPRENLRLILNRMPKRGEVTIEELEGMLGMNVYATLPNDYPALQEAYTEGRLLDTTSHLGRSFNSLARRVAGVTEEKKKKFSLFG